MNSQKERTVDIIARYELKQHPGIVVYTIRPSERSQSQGFTQPYRVTIAGGRAHCDCPAHTYGKQCYHQDALLAREQLRAETERAATFLALQATLDYRYQQQSAELAQAA
jgi:hypothetical protein